MGFNSAFKGLRNERKYHKQRQWISWRWVWDVTDRGIRKRL